MSGLTGNILMSGTHSQTASEIQDSGSLEEPVLTTIMRDLKRIGFKLKCVMMPRLSDEEKSRELRDWDLWGPLLFCLMLAMTLSLSSTVKAKDGGRLVFGIIFVVVWIGSGVVTLNAQLLGGTISFFHSVCLLGYCLFPLNLSAVILAFIGNINGFINLVVVLAGFGWSTFSSIGFMAGLVPASRKALAEYPLLLFYLFLAWFILVVS